MNTHKGMFPVIAIIIALLIIGGGGYAVKKVSDSTREKAAKAAEEQVAKDKAAEEMAVAAAKAARVLTVTLGELNKSGQTGEATITGVGEDSIKVSITLTGKASKVAQPAHIHLGMCPNPDAVKYPLTNVDKGVSETIVPITLDQILSELPLAVNVHQSAADAKTYTSCGDIQVENITAAVQTGMPAPGTDTKETVVTYDANGFSPKSITVKKGETVVFKNETGKPASVASNDHPNHLLYPEFDQYKTDQRGKDEFQFTFEKAGTWQYHDHLNAIMGGTVVVTE
ncbi:MAG: hypothetical protein UY50_C0012G0013 [Parcubacteria group bacterium GW2011_GWA2_49_9]|nr:MAG: hypothetical protein UY50_C0012G0013 [Parcubacteria group bacterium GW2011_GWA2_49_9]